MRDYLSRKVIQMTVRSSKNRSESNASRNRTPQRYCSSQAGFLTVYVVDPRQNSSYEGAIAAVNLFVRLDIRGVNVIVGGRFWAVKRCVLAANKCVTSFVCSWQIFTKAWVNKLKIKWHVITTVVESDSGIPCDRMKGALRFIGSELQKSVRCSNGSE